MSVPVSLRQDMLPSKVLREERINCLIHALGTALCLVGAIPLMWATVTRGQVALSVACGVYLATLIGVFAASTASHFFLQPQVRHFFRRLDQGFIYLLIAGTMTPYGMVYFSADGWSLMLVPIWMLATVGFCSKVVWAHRIEAISIVTYFFLGWVPIFGVKRIFNEVPPSGLAIICIGAACYTLGTVFLLLDRKCRWFHAVWHVLVIVGSACGYLGILLYAVPHAG